MQYIISNGTSYVMKNPMNANKYISTTSSSMAGIFTFKQARALINNNQKSIAWIRDYHMVEIDSGTTVDPARAKMEAEELFVEGEFSFDDTLLDNIVVEVESLLGLAAYEINELIAQNAILNQALSYCDLVLSDITHLYTDPLLKISAPQRSIIQKMEIDYQLKRKAIKQTRSYVDVMTMALENNWNLPKLKSELSKAKYVPYRGRTKIYDEIRLLIGKK